MATIRPNLAAKFNNEQDPSVELAKLSYPLLASPKIDGIRWMKPYNEPVMSRSWKPLPNKRLQEFMNNAFSFLDGEVIVGDDPTAPKLFNESQSTIMTAEDQRPFSIWVFDDWSELGAPFKHRTEAAEHTVQELRRQGCMRVNYVEHKVVKNVDEVLEYEQAAIEAGYEGAMLRNPSSPYKFGRSTLKEQGLIKLKRFADDEAEIIGFEPLERNTNPQVRDSFGLAKRSSHREGKVADNLLGRLLVRHQRYGDFAIGSGFDVDTRIKIWQDQEAYKGRRVTFKYQSHGTLDKPRMPIYKGLRED